VSETAAQPARTGSTVALSVHGPVGVLDLVVPSAASSVDVAREYADQTGLSGIPLLQTPTGRLLTATGSLADAGVRSGDVVVAVQGVCRPRRSTLLEAARNAPETPALASLIATVAALCAVLAGWYGARSDDDHARTVTVGLLMVCGLAGALPVGRHRRQRAAAAPAFAGAAAFAALYVPGDHLLPSVVAASGLAAAVVASVARATAEEPDEASTVWVVAGITVFATCALSPLLGWDARAPWALLIFLAMMASRFAPSLAIDVPDEALLDLDRLAVTAWSARDSGGRGRRGRIVVAGEAITHLVHRASRTVTAAAAAILVVMAVSAPLLLRSADIDLDRIGARCLVFFAGASVLLAARSYRHATARALLRLAGLAAWAALAVHLVATTGGAHLDAFFYVAVALGTVAVAAAVATGRGWRSVWWARRAEVAESLSGSLAFAAAVVAAGVFRRLWEITS
jgi:peptidoglycan/LPS O-acetylase OafA/YrhL